MNIELNAHNVREVKVETKERNGSIWTVLTIRAQYEGLPEETFDITLFHAKDGIVAPFLPEYAPKETDEAL